MSFKILIISDTHGSFKEIPYVYNLNEYSNILYLGDGFDEAYSFVSRKNSLDKFIYVSGNCDNAPEVPRKRFINIDGIKIFMTHGDLYDVKTSYDKIIKHGFDIKADIIMFGHTHYAENFQVDNLRVFNPGSIFPRKRDFASIGYLEINNGQIIELEHLKF
ncbi:MAG: phosphoesterase [Candidatus Sericytochromatia bacterium]|nr:MAG: phosphoesterase [Candidatus Sericytochromatia bacterium]